LPEPLTNAPKKFIKLLYFGFSNSALNFGSKVQFLRCAASQGRCDVPRVRLAPRDLRAATRTFFTTISNFDFLPVHQFYVPIIFADIAVSDNPATQKVFGDGSLKDIEIIEK
jgi:hypothetical protein